MPPKKRAASTKAGGKGAKVVKKEPDDGGLKAAVEKLKTADKGKKVTHTKDSQCSWPGTVVSCSYTYYILMGENKEGISATYVFIHASADEDHLPITWTKFKICR